MAYELTATTDYIRNREAFLIQIDMSDYLIDYYYHRKDLAASTQAEHDEHLKELIACFAIHLAARTTLETHAWTLHIASDDPYSLFVTGSTGEIDEGGTARAFLVGHILTDNIKHAESHGFHAQCIHRGNTFRSYVRCESPEIPNMVESFYKQSEQRPIRIQLSATSDTAVGLVALPGFDPEWFRSVDLEELARASDLDTTRMRTCCFTFRCDCSPVKLVPFFRTLSSETLSELYGSDEELKISCPRCGKQFTISRADIETVEQ